MNDPPPPGAEDPPAPGTEDAADQAGALVHRRPTSTGMMGATSATNGEAGDLYYYVDLQVRPCRTSSH